MKRNNFYILIALIAALIALSLPVSAKEATGEGGEVFDADSFLAAIGGEDAGRINDAGEVCLKSDVVLSAEVVIKGGDITVNGASCMFIRGFDGGSLFILDGGTLTLGNPKNTDKPETLIFDGNGRVGRAFEVKAGTLSLYSGSLVEGFVADGENGGALFVSGGEANIYGGIISSCSAANGGGASLSGGKLVMSGGQIKLCGAKEAGGGVYIGGGAFEFIGGTVGGEIQHDDYSTEASVMSDDGCAAINGGGIYVESGGDSFINGGIVAANKAAAGGGLYIKAGASMLLASGAVSYNNAENGGGLYNEGDALGGYIELSYNVASENGGGLYNSGSYSMKGGLINTNESKRGAGVYNNGGSFEISEGSVNYNTASIFGGGAYNPEGATLRIAGGSFGYNKLTDDKTLGTDIYSVGELLLENAVFIGGDGDLALGRKADGSPATATLVPPFTCTTTIARLSPVMYDGASDSLICDYQKRSALTVGEGSVSDYDHLFKVISDPTGGEWAVINGGIAPKPLGVWFYVAAAAALLAVTAGIVFAVKTRKH